MLVASRAADALKFDAAVAAAAAQLGGGPAAPATLVPALVAKLGLSVRAHALAPFIYFSHGPRTR